jgi:hypothetical protein
MSTSRDWQPSCLSNRQLAGLFCLALVPRLLLLAFGPWQDPDRALQPDSTRYLNLAENLREHHTFGLRGPGGVMHQSIFRLRAESGTLPAADANGLRPESFRTPGYPFFIALIESLGGNIQTILLIQCFLGAATACLAASIAQSLGLTASSAFLVGLLWALHPGLIVFDSTILAESLFNAVLVAGLFLGGRMPCRWSLLMAGFILGIATLIRPLGYFYVPAALALAWPRIQTKWLAILLMTMTAGLPPTLWALRNHAVGEGFRVTMVGDLNLLYYTAAYSISEERHEDWLESWPVRVDFLTNLLSRELERGEDVVIAARRLAWREIQSRPKIVAKVLGKSWAKLFLDHSLDILATTLGKTYHPTGVFSAFVLGHALPSDNQQESSWVPRIGAMTWMGLNALIALAALLGANRAIHQKQWQVLVFGVPTILLFTLATGSVGIERFRLPMMLPLFILAVYSLPSIQLAKTGN